MLTNLGKDPIQTIVNLWLDNPEQWEVRLHMYLNEVSIILKDKVHDWTYHWVGGNMDHLRENISKCPNGMDVNT